MKWHNYRRSENVEDRRKMGRPRIVAGAGFVIVVSVVMLLLGKDPASFFRSMEGLSVGEAGQVETTAHEDSLAAMASAVIASTEDVWMQLFKEMGADYKRPTLVLFTGYVESACGNAESAMGPFYCSSDSKVYLDLSFFDELGTRFGASGDFAQAYVIAHEVGHHVQSLLGTLGEVHSSQAGLGERERNILSVRLELQADYYAGIWAHYADKAGDLLEKGDIEEALNAASQIGDDKLQQQSQGRVVPDSFTHGSSRQRLKWFLEGYRSGNVQRAALLFTPDALEIE